MRASRSAAAGLVALAVFASAGCTAVTDSGSAAKPSDRGVSAAAIVTRALGSCGLSPTTPGITVGSPVLLDLATDRDGHPTGIDRLDAECALRALGLPKGDRALLQSTSITGGYQSATWADYTASWRFRDTLTFEVRVYGASEGL